MLLQSCKDDFQSHGLHPDIASSWETILSCALPTGMEALVEQERAAKLELARTQVAWDGEAAARLLQKLMGFFTAQLAAETSTLTPLCPSAGDAGAGVPSVMVPELPHEVQVRVRINTRAGWRALHSPCYLPLPDIANMLLCSFAHMGFFLFATLLG